MGKYEGAGGSAICERWQGDEEQGAPGRELCTLACHCQPGSALQWVLRLVFNPIVIATATCAGPMEPCPLNTSRSIPPKHTYTRSLPLSHAPRAPFVPAEAARPTAAGAHPLLGCPRRSATPDQRRRPVLLGCARRCARCAAVAARRPRGARGGGAHGRRAAGGHQQHRQLHVPQRLRRGGAAGAGEAGQPHGRGVLARGLHGELVGWLGRV